MAQAWKLTLRRGPRVEVTRLESLDAALDALAAAIDGAGEVRRGPARAFVREIAPVAQVAVRAQLAGPQRLLAKVHAGVDLRGDGSAEAWTGRVSKRVVELRAGESAVDGLRRVLGVDAGAGAGG
jgi:hypothetical protein